MCASCPLWWALWAIYDAQGWANHQPGYPGQKTCVTANSFFILFIAALLTICSVGYWSPVFSSATRERKKRVTVDFCKTKVFIWYVFLNKTCSSYSISTHRGSHHLLHCTCRLLLVGLINLHGWTMDDQVRIREHAGSSSIILLSC